jgi:uroporphyrinogen-III synthase
VIQRQAASRTTPLSGQRVLVTRARSQSAEMSRLLRELGAESIELPTIEIVPNPFPDQTRQTLSNLPGFDWIVFTSTNAVTIFFNLLREHGCDADRLHSARIAAVGRSTASCLRNEGIDPDFVPDEFHGDAVLEAMLRTGVAGESVLMPRAEIARETLPDGLRRAGADVHVLPIYRTVAARPSSDILDRLMLGNVDIVTFASSSSVNNLLAMLDGRVDQLSRTRIACIGPVTSRTVREHGFEPWVVASEHTVKGLIDTICTALEGENEQA